MIRVYSRLYDLGIVSLNTDKEIRKKEISHKSHKTPFYGERELNFPFLSALPRIVTTE